MNSMKNDAHITMLEKIKRISFLSLFFISYTGYSQDLKTVFLDSIHVNELIGTYNEVDTTIFSQSYSVRIDFNDDIIIFGNLDEKNRPHGNWIFTFSHDQFEYVKGNYFKGKRDGIWIIGCGARKSYKKGKTIRVTMCPF